MGVINVLEAEPSSASALASVSSSFQRVAYDSAASKNVVAYVDGSDSSKGKVIKAVVSSTSISVEDSAVTFNAGANANINLAYNSTAEDFVVVYRDQGNSDHGTSSVVTLAGAVPNFTIGSTYYVQNDGTISTVSSSVTAGKAIANTTLLLKG